MSCRTNGLVSRFLDFLARSDLTVDTDDIELPRDGVCRRSVSMSLILSSCLCRPSDATLEAQPFDRPLSTCQRDSKVTCKRLSFQRHLAPGARTQPDTNLHCKRQRIRASASRFMPVYSSALAATYCAYLRRGGQVELNCSLGKWLHAEMVHPPAQSVLSIE